MGLENLRRGPPSDETKLGDRGRPREFMCGGGGKRKIYLRASVREQRETGRSAPREARLSGERVGAISRSLGSLLSLLSSFLSFPRFRADLQVALARNARNGF